MIPVKASIFILRESQRIFVTQNFIIQNMIWYLIFTKSYDILSILEKTLFNTYFFSMNLWIYICLVCVWILLCGWVFLYFIQYKIQKFEQRLIALFLSRTDTIPAIYEISLEHINRHKEIFTEILELRKQEFFLSEIQSSLAGFINLESHIHHEINFIFQVCNKNQALLKTKEFLYCRDVIIQKSSQISQKLKAYKKIIGFYNECIRYKNYSLLWLCLPFKKKAVL